MTTSADEQSMLAVLVRDRLGLSLSTAEIETLHVGYRLLSTMLQAVDDDLPPSLEPIGQFAAGSPS